MRKYTFALLSFFMAATVLTTSCRQLHREENMSDTVAASLFEPADTSIAQAKTAKKKVVVRDSVGLYYIGFGSTHELLQLVSYPSRRDTLVFSKARHLRVNGNADYDHIVHPTFFVLKTGDSIVSRLDEWKPIQP